MRALQFIADHVIFKLRYNQIYQMKTTYDIRPDKKWTNHTNIHLWDI